jgi:hypothetical protein
LQSQQQQQTSAPTTPLEVEIGHSARDVAGFTMAAVVLIAGMEAAASLIVPVQVLLGGRLVTLGVNDVTSGSLGAEVLLQLIKQKYMERTGTLQAAVPGMRSAEAVADQSKLQKRDECCWNCGKTAKDVAKAGAGEGVGSSSSSSANKKLLKCSRCKRALYCSAECQKVHWKAAHKAMCKPDE